MRTALIITTYNRPHALLAVLHSVSRQTRLPDQVIIADDGSSDDTAHVIGEFAKNSRTPLIHAFQEDAGFRVARARNNAVRRTDCQYLIFVDGDMVLHRDFVISHCQFIKTNRFLHGRRVLLNEWASQNVIAHQQNPISFPFASARNRLHAIHHHTLAQLFSHHGKSWRKTRACNLSMHREDFISVNGFNEAFTGWGLEDSELAWRLMKKGLQKWELRFCGVAYHLDHGEDSRVRDSDATKLNEERLLRIIEKGEAWCDVGFQEQRDG